MTYVPHEKLSINWGPHDKSFALSLPWVSMEVGVTKEDYPWIKDATNHLHDSVSNQNVQRFVSELKEYPIFYIQRRRLEEFKEQVLQPCPDLNVDSSTPASLIATFGCEIAGELKKDVPTKWTWDWEKILSKARIAGTNLYDPVSFISYLICYRLEWENTTWSGQDGFGKFLEHLLEEDEDKFFQAMGWVVKQSWYVTSEACQVMKPALIHFEKARDLLHHYIHDEAGHHKFMEIVFEDLGMNKDNFPVGTGTKWQMDAFAKTAVISPLAFSALINLFEAAFYDGQDPISRILKKSSKPQAAHGYDLHYKINQDNRHCDMPVQLASYLAPQTYSHVALTLGIFELTLNFYNCMEKELAKSFKV
ncbi:MAG: hypothetical protein BGO67_05090 [Alphaproteobacteria bacterium 41-28]|nr:MAG: hypothetical protein BGO67_05090 [Alphaproteobacteria bacterium 41-28]